MVDGDYVSYCNWEQGYSWPMWIPLLIGLTKSALHRRFLLLGLVLGLGVAPVYPWAAGDVFWFDKGCPKVEARQAVEILLSAFTDGLDPEDYDAAVLAQAVARAESEPTLPAETLAALNVQLTKAMSHYLSDLQYGRIDPRQINAKFTESPRWESDPETYLQAAVSACRVSEAVRQLEPKIPLYAALRQALAHYRVLARDPAVAAAWEAGLPALTRTKLEPGQDYGSTSVLALRLVLLGDLPAGTMPGKRYQGALVDGVKSFQLRHGLEPDGVIGKGTLAQLQISPVERVRQIELAMERLRWTPLLMAPRMIVINIPEFILRAYENLNGQVDVKAVMKVVVGKAMNRRTPLFNEDMRFIEFSPYWNIPPSIAKEEIIPRLRRNPAYFENQGFEFVNGSNTVIAVLSDVNLQAVQRGKMRIRQRPGPKNPLGDVKFVFPNDESIYLHHTSATSLFLRDRRDFSHGCIRVQDPLALASYVLKNEPEWTEERIRKAMAKGESNTLRLAEPLPVVIAYLTAIARKDGRVYFFPDIYDHDRLLDEALRQRSHVLKIFRQMEADTD